MHLHRVDGCFHAPTAAICMAHKAENTCLPVLYRKRADICPGGLGTILTSAPTSHLLFSFHPLPSNPQLPCKVISSQITLGFSVSSYSLFLQLPVLLPFPLCPLILSPVARPCFSKAASKLSPALYLYSKAWLSFRLEEVPLLVATPHWRG